MYDITLINPVAEVKGRRYELLCEIDCTIDYTENDGIVKTKAFINTGAKQI